MTIWQEWMETWIELKPTHLLSICSLNCGDPFITSTFTSKKLVALLNINTRGKIIPPLIYTMYDNASNNTPIYTHIRLYMVRKVHPLGMYHARRPIKRSGHTSRDNDIKSRRSFMAKNNIVSWVMSSSFDYNARPWLHLT